MNTNAKATHLDLFAIRQHILNEFGIVLWALKTDCVQNIVPNESIISNNCYNTPEQNNKNNFINSHTNNNANIALQEPLPVKIKQNNSDDLINTQVHKIQNDLSVNNLIDLSFNKAQASSTEQSFCNYQNKTDLSIQTPTLQTPVLPKIAPPQILKGVQADIPKFHLSGISYGDWLILVDCEQLDLNEKAIWNALVYKLNQNPNVKQLDIHYPMVVNDYPEYENFLQGTYALLGFLLTLCAGQLTKGELSLKLALLTPLSAGIHLGHLQNHQKITPSLSQMAQNANAKKDFWQLIHSI